MPLFAVGILILIVAFIPEPEPEPSLYCEMVQIYHDTKGEYGWPPYKGECPDEQ